MYSKEDILFKALKVDERRVERWCQKVREPMLERIRKLPTNTTMERLKREWYGGTDGSYEHYNWTRYYALNLHSVFYRGTLEWLSLIHIYQSIGLNDRYTYRPGSSWNRIL